MGYRRKTQTKKIIVFLVLTVIFSVTTGFLAIQIPGKLSQVEQIKATLAQLMDMKEQLDSSIQDLEVNIEHMEADLNAAQGELEKVQKENPELKAALESTSSKKAYLTFDDGPSENTVKILDFLKANNIKATFFVLGKEGQEEIYKRIVEEGHTLAVHSNTHQYDTIYTSVESFMADIETLSQRLETATGVKPNILRFPGGSNNTISHKYGGKEIMNKIISSVEAAGYYFFDWNVDSLDASANVQDKNVIVESVINGAKGKEDAVILMHDAKPKTTTVQALPEIVEGLRMQGFTFESITENTPLVQF